MKDVQDTWNRIQEFDFTDLIRLYAKRYNHPKSFVTELTHELKKYLLIAKFNDKVGLASNDIDYFWHFFIICTPEYKDFCDNYLGKWINHNPAKWWDFHGSEFPVHLNALKLYENLFGYPPPAHLWHGVPMTMTDSKVLLGAVSHDTEICTPTGYTKINDLGVGDMVINTFGATSKINAITSYPTYDAQEFLKFDNYSWYFTSNLLLKTGAEHPNTLLSYSPERFRESLDNPIFVDVEDGICKATPTKNIEYVEKWNGSGIGTHLPRNGDYMYTLFVDGGYRCRGGINAMSVEVEYS